MRRAVVASSANSRTVCTTEDADALGSSRHTAAGAFGVLGIARGSFVADGTTIEFYTLAPPSCQ